MSLKGQQTFNEKLKVKSLYLKLNLEILKRLVTTLNLQGLFQKMPPCQLSLAAPPQSKPPQS